MSDIAKQNEAAAVSVALHERDESFCKDHPKIKMTIGLCHRCDGDGYTQHDLEEAANPIAFDNSGNCWQCKGTGHGFLECHVCEEEYRMEQQDEDFL